MTAHKRQEPDKYQHIAAILTNVTRLKPGRAMLLQPGRGLLTVLVAQAQSANLVRRQGCAAAFRNCCFSAEVCCPVNCLSGGQTARSAVLGYGG